MSARPAIGRRAVCAAPAALLLPVAGAASATVHPDQALLDVCAEFDALTQRIEDCYSRGATPIHDDDERDVFLMPFRDRQEALIGQLCALRATTPAGCRARAASLLRWDPSLTRPAEDARETCQLKRQMAALLRDLVHVGGAADASALAIGDAAPRADGRSRRIPAVPHPEPDELLKSANRGKDRRRRGHGGHRGPGPHAGPAAPPVL